MPFRGAFPVFGEAFVLHCWVMVAILEKNNSVFVGAGVCWFYSFGGLVTTFGNGKYPVFVGRVLFCTYFSSFVGGGGGSGGLVAI